MPTFDFIDPKDSQAANGLFAARGLVAFLALLAFLPVLLFFVQAETVSKEAESEQWFDDADRNLGDTIWGVCQMDMQAIGTCSRSDATTDKSKCLYLVSNGEYSGGFNAYKQACVKLGFVPVIIEDQIQNADVARLLGDHTPAWIGLEQVGGRWRLSATGAEPTYTNWHDEEPNGRGGKEDYAVLGMGILKPVASAIFFAALLASGCALTSVVVVCVVCCLQYYALQTKSDGMLSCLSLCDGCCGFLSCLGVVESLRESLTGESGGGSIILVILRFLSAVMLCGMAYVGWTLRTKIARQRQPPHASQTQVIGNPMVLGQPVMGQAVMGQPVAGSVLGT